MAEGLPPQYDPRTVEQKWSAAWDEKNLFSPDPTSDKPPYTIVIPPPNITGILHSLIWIVFHPQIIIKKRMHYKKINKSIDNEIFKCLLQKSIVVNYYVFGKKTYSSIVSKDA